MWLGRRLFFPPLGYEFFLRIFIIQYPGQGTVCAPFIQVIGDVIYILSHDGRLLQQRHHVSAAGRSRPYLIFSDVTFIPLAAAFTFMCAAAFIFGDVIVYFVARGVTR